MGARARCPPGCGARIGALWTLFSGSRTTATGEPYPVKAFFTLGNDTLMGFANMQRIHQGLLNQDLVVAVEHLRTPPAQDADFILPGATVRCEREAVIQSPAAICKDCIRQGSEGS